MTKDQNEPTSLKVDYESTPFTVTAKNVDTFVDMATRRTIRPGHVAKIRLALQEGKHFRAPIWVNRVGGQNHLIDGHHRIAALREYFQGDEKAKVQVVLNVFRNLTDAQAREIFVSLSVGKSISRGDTVHVNQADFPILHMMQNRRDFPASVFTERLRRDQRGFFFLNLVDGYAQRYNAASASGHGSTSTNRLDYLKVLDANDYRAIKGFTETYIGAFGVPEKGFVFNNLVPIHALMKVYFCNLEHLGADEIRRRWANKLLSNNYVYESTKRIGIGHVRALHDIYVAEMNRGHRKKAMNIGEWASLREGGFTNGESKHAAAEFLVA